MKKRKTDGFHTKEYIEKKRLENSGENNPMYGIRGKDSPRWKGEGGRTYFKANIYSKLKLSLEQKCTICGTIEKLIVHHIDGNFRNNELSNIQIVCRGCHNKIHKKGIPLKKWGKNND